ncbi:MAG: ATP-binding protein [Pseudomonadota bacterium]
MPHDGSSENQISSPLASTIEKTIPADYRWVRRTIHELEDDFVASGIGSEDIGSIAIVLAEALNNVVEHAFENNEGQDITLLVRARSKSLLFEIRDKGRPMPKGRAPVGNHPMSEFNQFDTLPEGGYGWFLIRELVQDLVYDRQNDENILFFRYKLSS